MSTNKFMVIIIILSLLILALILWLTYYDIQTANKAIAIKEYNEIKSIPDEIDTEQIRQLIKETDLIAWKLEQHRLELEKILEGKN